MKNVLFLLVFCLTSTLFVSGQTFKPFKSSSGSVLLQKTSNTTATLKFENTNGYVITKYLTLSNRQKTAEETMEDEIAKIWFRGTDGYSPSKIWNVNGEDDYVITKPGPMITTSPNYSVFYHNALGRKIWDVVVY